jgi:nucleotide-binding universal stress UspA family protein
MIKDILLNLSMGAPHDFAGEYAISVADAFGAHLAAVAFSYGAVVPPTIMGGIPGDFVEAQQAESDKAAQAAITRFEEAARVAGLSAEARMLALSLGEAADRFGAIGRRYDLSIVAQAQPDKVAPEELIIEAALFESGRPVLVVPYIQTGGLKLDRVMVCWNASRNAARAIGDGMAFLRRAGTIDLVIVANERLKGDEIPGADIAHHLARHGLKVDLKRVVAGDVDVPNTILSHAADVSADFIVMGAYGHSRLREFILGGATRGILTSMTVPVLMSH